MIADADGGCAALLLSCEPDIDEKAGWAAVVANQVAQEDVGDVAIDFEHGYTNRWYSNDYQIAMTKVGSYCLFCAAAHGGCDDSWREDC